MQIKNFSEDYFLKFRTSPVKLKPWRQKQAEIGKKYLKLLRDLLKGTRAKIMIKGSTAYKILGKGEVELGIYPPQKQWQKVIKILTKEFGEPETTEKDYVRFNDYPENEKEVEITLLKGKNALIDLKLHKYLLSHLGILKRYAAIKKKYCFSKREYLKQKHIFLSSIIEKF